MAKRKKPKMAWKTVFSSTKIIEEDIAGMKMDRNDYVSYFETYWDAAEFKVRKLHRISLMYKQLKEELPEMYSEQIKEMKEIYEKENKELPIEAGAFGE